MAGALVGDGWLQYESACTFGGLYILTPGYQPWWNLCVYSKYLMTRNVAAPARVRASMAISSFFLFCCAAVTPQAIVRLLRISTAVLVAPSVVLRKVLPYLNKSG